MRHRKALRKFGLPSDQRRALLKSLTRSMIVNDRILTTETRAKEIRPLLEKLVTIALKGGESATQEAQIHARREVRRFIDSNVKQFVKNPDTGKTMLNPNYIVPRLFDVIAPRYKDRNGGYTRIIKVGFRKGDGAPLVLLEWVDAEKAEEVEEVQAPEEKKRNIFNLGRSN